MGHSKLVAGQPVDYWETPFHERGRWHCEEHGTHYVESGLWGRDHDGRAFRSPSLYGLDSDAEPRPMSDKEKSDLRRRTEGLGTKKTVKQRGVGFSKTCRCGKPFADKGWYCSEECKKRYSKSDPNRKPTGRKRSPEREAQMSWVLETIQKQEEISFADLLEEFEVVHSGEEDILRQFVNALRKDGKINSRKEGRKAYYRAS